MLKLIIASSELNKSITKFATSLRDVHTQGHVLMVSTMVHAAQGGVQPLQALYNILPTSYQTMARSYLSLVKSTFFHRHKQFDDLPKEAKDAMFFLNFQAREVRNFILQKDTNESRKWFDSIADKELLNLSFSLPDTDNHKAYVGFGRGENKTDYVSWAPFMKRFTIPNAVHVLDERVLSQLKAQHKRITEDTELRTSDVSAQVVKIIEKAIDEISTFVGAHSEDVPSQAKVDYNDIVRNVVAEDQPAPKTTNKVNRAKSMKDLKSTIDEKANNAHTQA